ncbi:MAG: iron-containing redox enzyme family protein [Nostocaceae cyanobacterium]|nr:iron-containing redox enzyme family protein [Nostocaceae cyanobacterium]
MEWIKQQDDPYPALRVFSENYHYFSINQAVSFARLFSVIPAHDRDSLVFLADMLHQELGQGKSDTVHSVIFERFAKAVGVDMSKLPLAADQVVEGVRWYACELDRGFGGSLPCALATYQFVEGSGIDTYAPLLGILRDIGLSEEDLEFFTLHAEVEIDHTAIAANIVERARETFTPEQNQAFNTQKWLLQRAWEQFWGDILLACQRETSNLAVSN